VNSTTLIRRISNAFANLFDKDAILFTLGIDGVNEQTITFRLGHYLQREFPDLNVDCEYNRHWDGVKRCYVITDLGWMKPDLIVHRRQSNRHNMFTLEAKKRGDSAAWVEDWRIVECKLHELTIPGEYGYTLGVAWKISPSAAPADHEMFWFTAGKKALITTLSGYEESVIDLLDRHRDVARLIKD
jgi:hypothetical protein